MSTKYNYDTTGIVKDSRKDYPAYILPDWKNNVTKLNEENMKAMRDHLIGYAESLLGHSYKDIISKINYNSSDIELTIEQILQIICNNAEDINNTITSELDVVNAQCYTTEDNIENIEVIVGSPNNDPLETEILQVYYGGILS